MEHLSGEKHTTGEAIYTDGIRAPEGEAESRPATEIQVNTTTGTLHMQLVHAHHAHAKINAIHVEDALQIPGVVRVLTFDDLPQQYRDSDPGLLHCLN